MNFQQVNDSGARENFDTGSVRDTREGKGRYDLIPPYPLQRLAVHYENGAKKYGDRNWEKGQPLMRYLDSALRHINNILAGDNSEDHASAVVWNIFGYIHTLDKIQGGFLPKELDDRPLGMLGIKDVIPTQNHFGLLGEGKPEGNFQGILSDIKNYLETIEEIDEDEYEVRFNEDKTIEAGKNLDFIDGIPQIRIEVGIDPNGIVYNIWRVSDNHSYYLNFTDCGDAKREILSISDPDRMDASLVIVNKNMDVAIMEGVLNDGISDERREYVIKELIQVAQLEGKVFDLHTGRAYQSMENGNG